MNELNYWPQNRVWEASGTYPAPSSPSPRGFNETSETSSKTSSHSNISLQWVPVTPGPFHLLSTPPYSPDSFCLPLNLSFQETEGAKLGGNTCSPTGLLGTLLSKRKIVNYNYEIFKQYIRFFWKGSLNAMLQTFQMQRITLRKPFQLRTAPSWNV